MIGIIDESTPWDSDDHQWVLYTLALVLVDQSGLEDLRVTLPMRLARRRPFHWESDAGPRVRGVVLNELQRTHVVVVAVRARRDLQTDARRRLFEDALLPTAREIGVTHLVIERQSNAENDRDKRIIRDWARQQRIWRPDVIHVGKDDAATWLADAAAGLWSDTLLGRSAGEVERLAASRSIRAAILLDS